MHYKSYHFLRHQFKVGKSGFDIVILLFSKNMFEIKIVDPQFLKS